MKKNTFISHYFKVPNNVFSTQCRTQAANFIQRRQVFNKPDKSGAPLVVIPEQGKSPAEVLKVLEKNVLPHIIHTGSPEFIGHMTSQLPNFLPGFSQLVTAMNQNIVKYETSGEVSTLESDVVNGLHQFFYGNDDEYYVQLQEECTTGVVCSGGTLANIAALQCARNKCLEGVRKEGLHAQQRVGVVICSRLGHYSLSKAMDVLGLGTDHLIAIDLTENLTIDLSLLEAELIRCQEEGIPVIAVIGIAGSTETGTIDPLNELADLAAKYGTYFHVDAAWGGPVWFSSTHKQLLNGIQRADSITIDGHKQLYVPMGLGIVLFKEPGVTQEIKGHASYIIRRGSADRGRFAIEGSRPANILYLWAAFQIMGRHGYEILIDHGIELAQSFAILIQRTDGFELLVEPQTNILLYRYIPESYRGQQEISAEDQMAINKVNELLQHEQLQRGESFVSRTHITLPGLPGKICALRVVLANPLTSDVHLKTILDQQLEIVQDLSIE